MQPDKHLRFLVTAAEVALGGLTLWLILRFLLPWTLPFLIALALSALLERPVRFLTTRLSLPRWAAAAGCTLLLVLLLSGALLLAGWRLWYETSLLLDRLPRLIASLPSLGAQAEDWAYRYIIAAPPDLQDFLWDALETLLDRASALPAQLYDQAAAWVAALLTALPQVGLFLFTTALATYFSSAGRPALLSFLRRQVPVRWRSRLHTGLERLRSALKGWMLAQGTLMLITFGELAAGFLLLGVELAILLAALVALVDALPVFGTGTVLLPWAAVELLSGRLWLGLGLLVLYGVVTLVRSLLEPKLTGARAGLPPLAALLAMYVGFQALGVAGMVLSPLCAVLLKELHDCGLLRLWRD